MRIKLSRKYVALCLALLLSFLSAPAFAYNANSFYFEDFDADYYLSKDEEGVSHLKVVERLTAVFPNYNQNHGITRVIPFTNNDGKNLTMASTSHLNIEVLRNGSPEKVSKIESENGYFQVYIGDASKYVHGTQTYTLTYEFENVILDQSETITHNNAMNDVYPPDNSITESTIRWQELYWDTNGNDWSQRFDHLTARVHFDDDVKEAFDGRKACYVGHYGENNSSRCTVSTISDGLEFSVDNLKARENLTFVIGFKADTFTIRERTTPIWPYICLGIFFIVGIVVLFLASAFSQKSKPNREYEKSLFIKPEYTPPLDLTVAEMASIYLKKSEMTGNPMVSTLLELATSHKIAILSSKTGHKTTYSIRILSTDLKPEQKAVLQMLAGTLDDLTVNQEITPTSYPKLSQLMVQRSLNIDFFKDTEDVLVKKGLLERSRITHTYQSSGTVQYRSNTKITVLIILWAIYGFLNMPLIFAGFGTYGDELTDVGVLVFVLTIIYTITIAIIASSVFGRRSRYDDYTHKGIEHSRMMDGLHLYIKTAETERLKMFQSVEGADTTNEGIVKLYERLLPYASLFGLEKSWLKELGHYYELVGAPDWYIGNDAFSTAVFINSVSHLTSTTRSTFSHSGASGSSSSSSGFSSGGGFSGGGGGGGGGGGW